MGGTHIQAWGFIAALAKKFGPGEFAMLHVDAHYDTYGPVFGSFIHNGSFDPVLLFPGDDSIV